MPCLFYENDFEDKCSAIFRMAFLEEKFQNFPIDLEMIIKNLMQQTVIDNK